MAYSDNFPATRPVFQADFANGGKIDPRATFSRADTASSGDWSAATNSPALADGSGTANQYYRVSVAGTQDLGSGSITYAVGDYVKYSGSVWFKTTQPISVTYWSNEKHLSSENLITNSEALTGTGYTAVNVTPTTGQADPTGGTNAVRFEQDSGQTTSGYVLVENQPSSGQFTYSFHAKANGKNYIVIQEVYTDSSLNETWFSISGAGGAGTTNANHTNVTVTKFGDWYRCSWTMTSARVGYLRIGVADSDGSTTVTDSGGVYLYGLQRNTGGSLLDYQSTSGSIHRQYAPTLKSVATAGQPRFEYDPSADGQSMGILIEGQTQNLIGYGSSVGNWSSSRAAVTDNCAIAPNGELKADLMIQSYATGVNGSHFRYPPSVSVTSGSAYTTSIYIKSAGHRYVQLAGGSGGFASQYVNYDLTTATLSATGSGCSGSISSVGNGWYRITSTMTAEATASAGPIFALVESLSSGRFATFIGDDYSGVLLWGAQFEASSFASSLVDTGTGSSALTRAAESLSMDLSAFGIGNEVTAVGEAISTAVTSNRETVIHLSPSGSNDVALYAGRNVGGGVSSQFYAGGGDVYLSGGTVTAGSAYKFAAREAPANHAVCLNGGTVATNTSAVDATNIGTLHIGSRSGGTGANSMNGHIKRVALYNEALSDTNLQALTS